MRRTHKYSIRLDDHEYKQVQHNAQEFNLSCANYFRALSTLNIVKLEELIDSDGNNAAQLIIINDKELAQIRSLFLRANNNLNQAAYALNVLKKYYKDATRIHDSVAYLQDTLEEVQNTYARAKEGIDTLHTDFQALLAKRSDLIFVQNTNTLFEVSDDNNA